MERQKIESGKVKPEYENLSMDEYVPLDSIIPKEFSGRYEINKNCSIRNKITKKVWTSDSYYVNKRGYSEIAIGRYPSKNIIGKTYCVHILVAKIFLVNDDPEHKTIVDHINHIRSGKNGLNINNLRWVTPKENNNNLSHYSNNKKVFKIYNKSRNFIEQKTYDEFTSKEINGIKSGISRYNGYYKGLYYERIDLEFEDYKEKWGEPDPNGWKQSRFEGIECNIKGYIKYTNINKISLGTLKCDGYRYLSFNKNLFLIHRLIYETFNNIILTRDQLIDHIDTIRNHNELSNLKICSQKENMNNPITKQKLSKQVSKINPLPPYNIIHTYNSIKDAAIELNKIPKNSHIGDSCNRKKNIVLGYLWAHKGDEENRINDYINSLKLKEK